LIGVFNSIKIVCTVVILLILASCKKDPQTEVPHTAINIGESVNIQQIAFLNDSVGYICGGKKGETGIVYKTNDGGKSWQRIYTQNTDCLYGLSFINDSIGFACGENSLLLKTTDAGNTWINQHNNQGQPPSSFNSTLRNIFCWDEKTIYVAGGNNFEVGLTYKTYNGGEFWIYNTFDKELRNVYFKNKYNGYFCGYGAILKTTDSAFSFNPLPIDNDFFVSVSFPADNIGYAAGYNGGIYKTSDEGASWSNQVKANNDINHKNHFNAIKFLDDNKGYAVGNNGLIMFTEDGGENWRLIKKFTEDSLFSIGVKNKHELFITSSNGIIYLLTI
jgi:photosystem II stability/assembly factor-like uncharacterized protein